MTDVVIVSSEDDTAPPTNPAHELEMQELREGVEEAKEAAVEASAMVATTAHICRCDEVEIRVMERLAAMEQMVVAEEEEVVAEEDEAIAEAIIAAEKTEAETAPAPPVKEKAAPEKSEPTERKRSGMSKGWFGNRVK